MKASQHPEGLSVEPSADSKRHDASNPGIQWTGAFLNCRCLKVIVNGTNKPDGAEKTPAEAENTRANPEPLCCHHAIRSFQIPVPYVGSGRMSNGTLSAILQGTSQ